MRYKYQEKDRLWDSIQMVLFFLFLIIVFALGIWYQWLDISTKLAIRDMAKQQQESKP